jgi:hypothetical protein
MSAPTNPRKGAVQRTLYAPARKINAERARRLLIAFAQPDDQPQSQQKPRYREGSFDHEERKDLQAYAPQPERQHMIFFSSDRSMPIGSRSGR